MFNVTSRVSFSVAIALIVGWGIFFILFLASSNATLAGQQQQIEQTGVLARGVKLNIQVDKRAYKTGDSILIAVRNDSRQQIWIKKMDDACADAWWGVEHLESDGESWVAVDTGLRACQPTGAALFASHSLKSGEWLAVTPASSAYSQPQPISSGTYRITMPYAKGKSVTPAAWPSTDIHAVNSLPFSVL